MSKLEEFNKEYEKIKGEKLNCIMLEIHMPTGEIENIVNPNIEEKVKYINKVYSNDLVHANCKDIYIVDYTFVKDDVSYDFGWALALLKDGQKVARKGWNGKGMYIEYCEGKDHDFSIMEPFLLIKNVKNSFNTWVPSISDLLADDWEIAE